MYFRFLLAGLLTVELIRAQSPTMVVNNGNGSINDINGAVVPTFNSTGIEGNRYFSEEWNKGTVWFENGKYADSLLLQFDIVANTVNFKRNGQVQAFVDKVKSFSFYTNTGNKETSLIFRSGFPDYGQQDKNSFYQVLADGNSIQLLKFNKKKITETYVYNNPPKKKYSIDETLFVYTIVENRMSKVGLSKKSIGKILPNYSDIIESLCKKNDWNLKSEQELVLLIGELNKLIAEKK